ncbi:PREDICTED: cornifelin homolog A-like [Nanorana parkeri]|uniref:cornifelin homolog A-like n=1 Tax=Nanorana parkeri TaxID=125878 RepID=UPI000854A335|nr:PREDICTED: cornifelin homolog A-like [Nanorana parkeri]
MQTISVQPPSVISHTTTLSQPNPVGWSSGICDCCDDVGTCCFAYWCFPCFLCATVNEHGECLCLPMLDTGCLGCSPICPPVSMAMRASVRERYKIPVSICADCCILYWCFTCAWCQMAREIKKYKHPTSMVTAHTTTVTMPGQTVMYPVPSYQPQPTNIMNVNNVNPVRY